MKKQPKKNHFSIQIQYRLSNELPTELYKSTNESKADAVKACINKARALWEKNKKFEPYKVRIVDELTTEVRFEKVV